MDASCCPSQIFRAYDIRGKIGEEITPERVRRIAQTYASRYFSAPPRLVVGRDLRESSKVLAEAAIEGLVAAGAEVWDVGEVPSPLVYFAIGRWGADGGIVVTASHLPP
ncbi:MAG: phosphomannomutase/phosphoglucomutase, partial [Armatimonadetes bacterium]|nr:phosphomannomutase/phosphoglucomutase [Armatimonadota bacterium]